MSFYDYVHEREYEDEQYRAQVVGVTREMLGPTSSDFQDAAQQISQERERQCEWALREALTKGISIKNLEILCAATGISYDRVVMNTACEVPQTSLNTFDTDKDSDMKQNEMIESKFLKQDDVPEDKLVTVQAIKKENMANADQPPEYKWTVKFEELAKPMAMNSTNLKRMFKYCGEDSDDWIGKKVVVYTDPDVEFKGEIVGGLRIRQARRPGSAAPTPKRTEDFDDSIPF